MGTMRFFPRVSVLAGPSLQTLVDLVLRAEHSEPQEKLPTSRLEPGTCCLLVRGLCMRWGADSSVGSRASQLVFSLLVVGLPLDPGLKALCQLS